MATYDPVTHVIFDVDGLLLDTERLYTEATQLITSEYGKDYLFELKVQCMGMKKEMGAKVIIDSLELPITVPQYFEKIEQHYERLFPTSKLLPGAEKLVNHLHKHKVPIAIASGGSRIYFDMKTENHQKFFSVFNHLVLASSDPEVTTGKPAPDVFLICAKRFPDTPDAKKCLVFEDAPLGVKSARAAGMQVVLVPDKRLPAEKREGATQVIETLEDFQPELFGLPPF